MNLFNNQPKEIESYVNLINETQDEINNLTKKYQDEPDTLIKDYDNVIMQSIIGIIANFTANEVLRSDIISNVSNLIIIRQFVIDNHSNGSSNDNN